MRMSPKEKLFFRLPSKLLVVLEEDELYLTQVSKTIDVSWAHVVKLIKDFKKWGFADSKKLGRRRIIVLTPDGKELALLINVCFEKLKKIGN